MYIRSVPATPGPFRIGEFARRVGVSAELLRAWERRYGLLAPVRSSGGFRLYTDEDTERVARMRRALQDGLSAAEAAQAALDADAGPRATPSSFDGSVSRMMSAIRDFDEPAVHAILDENLAAFALEAVVRDLLLPALTEIGSEWERGNLLVSQEHFASNVIRGRLLSLARLWGRGSGPLALLACAPGELHDISLLILGLLLRSYGWRILFLGADTPLATIADAAASTHPAVLILSTFNGELRDDTGELRRLTTGTSVFLCGPASTDELCAELGITLLDGDLIWAAEAIATGTV
jgi:DNA-binding transcriptional MerR regulator